MERSVKLFLLLVFLCSIIAACTPPGPGGFVISGYVRDGISGEGIEDATVMIGDQTTQTDSQGSFTFSYSSGTAMTTNVFVYKGIEYAFWAVYEVTIDVSSNPEYGFFLMRNDLTGLTTITLDGILPVVQAGQNAHLQFIITNPDGGVMLYETDVPEDALTYTLTDVATFGTGCLVSVLYYDDDTDPPIRGYYSGVDIIGDTTINLSTFTSSTVSITGAVGELCSGDIYHTPSGIPSYVEEMLSTSPQDFTLYNGDDYPVIWKTAVALDNTPDTNYRTMKANVGPATPFSSASPQPVTLAAASSIPAPSTLMDMNDVKWYSATNTLEFGTASGATLYMCQFRDDNGLGGFIFTNATTIVMPDDFFTEAIDPGLNWDIKFISIYSNKELSNYIGLKLGRNGPVDLTDCQISFVDYSGAGTPLNLKQNVIP